MKLLLTLAVIAVLAVGAGVATWYFQPRSPAIPPRPELTLRIREGDSLAKLAIRLADQGVASSSDEILAYWSSDGGWGSAVSTATAKWIAKVKPADASLEGYLFPDTYRVFTDQALSQLTAKATAAMADAVQVLLTDLPAIPQGLDVHEVLTLASIVEREVATEADRRNVADVFLKRLDISMALQSDATVNYVTGKSVTQPTAADLAASSAYNTYQNRGLPPGPISNPSLSSIQAVLRSTSNPYYYFLSTTDGTTIFSRTGEEHSAAKQKYLR
jgi:UPF0755 protein